MSLKCAIIGLTNTGKTTLFNCMSETKAEISDFAFSTNKSNIGVIQVPDPRLYELNKYQETQRIVPATVEIIDVPGLTKGSNHGEGVGNKFLADIRNADALIHVLRCFDDDNLPHIDGTVDPVRDLETVNLELQIKDLESVEKKIEKTEKLIKAGEKNAKVLYEVLLELKKHLENFQNARSLNLTEEQTKLVADLQLLTAKPVIYVCNVDEASVISGNAYTKAVKEAVSIENTQVLIIAAAAEAEISELETEEEREEFLKDLGINEPGVHRLIRAAYALLNLKSFFTIGPKEIRAWTIKDGMTAQQAAGVIHSDLERGFIRAEVIKYDDFIELGSEDACRKKGKLRLEGKNYIVQDGDLMHIRFNV
ncbi:MAG: redox-regulated ATPase YchF [Marinilabiliales bacterium]